ncbi:hypothetical protein SD71_00060 [Cohnella kolymensis]|uniref:DUF4015 domain-containing protein n=1 Tax=Cohnella kolymensis TaxID=1590652 RepID=A0ABR5A8M2_9BACL|nr:hypothetical protein [Cohnella kolymensis]KIL37178.1 hypothetical protein SD71_00060 [Cohnella kolymensis]
MRRDTLKLLIFAGIVGFAVLYGMELSSKGIADVNGSWDSGGNPPGQQVPADEEWQLPAREKPIREEPAPSIEPDTGWQQELNEIPRNDREPLVDRVSGKTAEVLHDLSRNGIRFVVSIFDGLTG